MRNIFYTLAFLLIFIVTITIISCKPQGLSECNSTKITLLIKELLNKKGNYYISHETEFSKNNYLHPSNRFIYLLYKNITIPKIDYFVKLNNINEKNNQDSIKVIIVGDINIVKHNSFIGIELLKANQDTTEVKIKTVYGSIDRLMNESIFDYKFDLKNCKWFLTDSTINIY